MLVRIGERGGGGGDYVNDCGERCGSRGGKALERVLGTHCV